MRLLSISKSQFLIFCFCHTLGLIALSNLLVADENQDITEEALKDSRALFKKTQNKMSATQATEICQTGKDWNCSLDYSNPYLPSSGLPKYNVSTLAGVVPSGSQKSPAGNYRTPLQMSCFPTSHGNVIRFFKRSSPNDRDYTFSQGDLRIVSSKAKEVGTALVGQPVDQKGKPLYYSDAYGKRNPVASVDIRVPSKGRILLQSRSKNPMTVSCQPVSATEDRKITGPRGARGGPVNEGS